MYTADKHKQSHLPLQKNLQKQHSKPQVQSKTIYPHKKLVPSHIQTPLPKQMTISPLPPVPHGILRRSSPVILPTPPERGKKIFS